MMRFWIGLGACALIMSGAAARPSFATEMVAHRQLLQLSGSEVYIEQPPNKALEKKDPDVGSKDGGSELKPAEGPPLPSAKQPESCDPQNTPSQACYTATQQARPIPR